MLDSRLGTGFNVWRLLIVAASYLPAATAQSCISLAGSTACPAFNASSISTDSDLVGLFPFLSSVTSISTFDSGIQDYIPNSFFQTKYQTLLGCSNVNTTDSAAYYARYTTSVLCNAIVQNSVTPCGLSGNTSRPLCADSCAVYAQSEQQVAASSLCGTAGSDALSQIRADFTNCALPSNSLMETCVPAHANEPDNCGYSSNLGLLCSYCAASSPNATDSCCVFSNTTSRCQGVSLPIIASEGLAPVTITATSSYAPSSTGAAGGTGAAGAAVNRGLTGGQIAGIVVGAVVGAILLLALIILGCILFRKRHASSPATSIFNQPATMEEVHPATGYTDGTREQERAGLAVPFGARVARMSALESSSSSNGQSGGLGGYRKSTSSESEQTPHSRGTGLVPPTTAKRSASLSSSSHPGMIGDTSPSSGNDYTSPESQGQSEQLAFFKDYYSQDEMHAGDLVSTLWAYEPRAADEFSLDRGDMIKVLGIWDDGWATGVRVRQRADDWRPEDKVQRDSGMSNGSSRPPDTAEDGEVKAFPLVCVCLPQYWRKTVEGEVAESPGDY